MSDSNFDELTQEIVENETQWQLPRKYKVILLNDDYTPMEFVIEVLERFFQMDSTKAATVMLQIHTRGLAICGIFTRDIAETKLCK